MKSFLQYCGDEKRELPLYKTDENTKRSAIATWAYPSSAIRAQYPAGYFMPIAADALQKLGKEAK